MNKIEISYVDRDIPILLIPGRLLVYLVAWGLPPGLVLLDFLKNQLLDEG